MRMILRSRETCFIARQTPGPRTALQMKGTLSLYSAKLTRLTEIPAKRGEDLLFAGGRLRRRDDRPPDRNDRAAGGISGGVGPGQHFFLDVFHKILNLALHLLHALAHLQDD